MKKYIIDESAWQEACNGISCRECSMLYGDACRIDEYIQKQHIYEETERPNENTKLIDANAFWSRVIKSRKETIIDDKVTISMSEFIKLLDDEPTITIPTAELDTTTEETRTHGEWEYLKEHITEMRDADGELNQKQTCQFILELMGVIEREGDRNEQTTD